MNQYVNFLILGIVFIIIIASIVIVSINISKKNSVKKMYEDIEKLFNSIIPQNNDGYKFVRKTIGAIRIRLDIYSRNAI